MRVRRAGFIAPSFVTLSAVALALAATTAQAADEPAATDGAGVKETVAAAPDYYTRRAESVIAAEKKAALKPHPLAEAYPGFSVVVCEAGCPGNNDAQIVFARPAGQTSEATQAEMLTTADRGDARPEAETNLACVAGCYGSSAATDAVLPEKTAAAADETWPATVSAEHVRPAPARPVRDKLSPIR